VHITGAGSCTIAASQPGDANYGAAPGVSQTFTIARASQSITFGALANRRLGDPDFTVGASASSGLPVTFAATGPCTVSAGQVHLAGAGSCTLRASQPGNTDYAAAPDVSQTFSIAATTSCTVPKVVGRKLAAAKSAIKKAHCLTGKVRRAFSSRRKKGLVISQSRKSGQVAPADSKVDLVVSRGRKR
jgi:hypothetical protein